MPSVEMVHARTSRRAGYSRFDVRPVATLSDMAAEAPRFAPEIVLLDVKLPDVLPERAIAIVRDTWPHARVVLPTRRGRSPSYES